VEGQLGIHALEPGVFRLQLLDEASFRSLKASILGIPRIVGRGADTGLAADVLDRGSGIGLFEDRDDLGLGEPG
jgi:hypothetical protein